MIEGLQFNKTRMAPTPSCYLHLGNILSFAITASIAKRSQAKILLRIDDFDLERTNKHYLQDIFDTLNFLEIPWDEGPRTVQEFENEYSQVHRMGLYNEALQQLKDDGALFACSCSRTQVQATNPDAAYPGTCENKNIPFDAPNVRWRVRTDDTKNIAVKNLDGSVTNTTLPTTMHDFFIRKRDGLPAYQLISVVDDLHFGIDMVVRGQDLWTSTLAQLYLADLLGHQTLPDTTFYHHPLLMSPDGHKLSKSLGDPSVYYYRKDHKKPADIYTLIARMMGFEGVVGNWEELVEMLNLVK